MTAPVLMALLVLAASAVAGPEIPGAPQEKPIALVGGKVFPITGTPIDGGTVLFADGRIVAVGRDVELPEDVEQIGVAGKHVYPSLVNADGDIGLIEINAVRATNDTSEVGRINPNVRAETAVNPDSELIPVTRSGGVLVSLTSPAGGLIAGTSAVIHLDGWTWEDMTLKTPVALHIRWPRMRPVREWWNDESAEQQRKARDEALRRLHDAFAHARAHQKSVAAAVGRGESPQIDIRWQAMAPVLDKQIPVIAHADDIEQIQSAIAFATEQDIRLAIYGGYDAVACRDLLSKHDVSVIIAGVHRLPMRPADDYDAPFTLPNRLRKAGIKFCISGAGRFGASNLRNLPYHAGHAVAFGLPHDEALKAVTLYPAEILGVSERVGSLEKGKDATLIVTSGDVLDTFSRVEMAFIQGRAVDLSDRHKRLWKKYEEKYRRLGLD